MPPSDSIAAGYGPGGVISTRSESSTRTSADQCSSGPHELSASTPGSAEASSSEKRDSTRTRYDSRPSMRDEAAACERAFGYPPANVYDISDRSVACCLIRIGQPSGLPKALDAKLRAELAALWAVPV